MGSLSRSVPPQVGMLHFDKEWREELTMLRLAVHHVNALRPRFVVISGDLINAFPKEEAAQVVDIPLRAVTSARRGRPRWLTDLPAVAHRRWRRGRWRRSRRR